MRNIVICALFLCLSLVANAGKTIVICEHKSKSISCQVDQVIKIVSAFYGRTSKTTCPNTADYSTNCKAVKSLDIVKSLCDWENACSLEASNAVFGDPCKGTFKYLRVVYNCSPIGAQTDYEAQLVAAKFNSNVLLSTGCGDDPADIVFLLDTSGSVGNTNFGKTLDFVKILVDEFIIGPSHAKVAVLIYGSRVYNQFHLNKYMTKASLKSAIEGIKYHGGGTYTSKAIKFAREDSFKTNNGARQNSTKVAIIVTDGKSQYATRTASESKRLRDQGVTIFSIGIGKNVKMSELNSMASDPDSSHVFRVDNFDALKTIKGSLAKKACEVDGGWSNWTLSGQCSKTCGGGTLTQKRECNNPTPKNGGQDCVGSGTRTQACNTQNCPNPCTCRVSGDPHYKTFDGQWIHFQGVCKYLLTEVTDASDPCWISVSGKNENRGNNRVSFLRSIDVNLRKRNIRLRKNGEILIDGVQAYLPYTDKGVFKIKRSGKNVLFETSCGAMIIWDGKSVMTVSMPGKFKNKLKGMCGDCNGKKDDLKTKNGTDVSAQKNKYNLIAESWRVQDDSGFKECTPPDAPPNCSPGSLKEAKAACGLLNSNAGPFADCIKLNAPRAKEFYDNCLYDYCAYTGKVSKDELEKVVCKAVEGFAAFCEEKGKTQKWRSTNFCPLPCDENQMYDSSASGCPATCSNPDAAKTCKLPNVEACVCRRGYLLSDDKCIKENICGCTRNGTYYPLNSRVTTCNDEQGEELSCRSSTGKAVLSVRKLCTGNFICKVINQKHQCVCKDGYIDEGGSCKPIDWCLIKREPLKCGVTLYGSCLYEFSVRNDCKYSVRTYKIGTTTAPKITINDKAFEMKNGVVKDCVTIMKRDTAVFIEEKGCPTGCQ